MMIRTVLNPCADLLDRCDFRIGRHRVRHSRFSCGTGRIVSLKTPSPARALSRSHQASVSASATYRERPEGTRISDLAQHCQKNTNLLLLFQSQTSLFKLLPRPF